MIEYSVVDGLDHYLAWAVKAVLHGKKQDGWWLYGIYDQFDFARGSIESGISRQKGTPDIYFHPIGKGLATVHFKDHKPFVDGISITDQIILEKMIKRFRKIEFNTKLTRRKVKL